MFVNSVLQIANQRIIETFIEVKPWILEGELMLSHEIKINLNIYLNVKLGEVSCQQFYIFTVVIKFFLAILSHFGSKLFT